MQKSFCGFCSSSVEASMQAIIEGLHISGILNFLVCADTEVWGAVCVKIQTEVGVTKTD